MGILKFIFAFVISSSLFARPVSYPGGLTAMPASDDMKDSVYVHYSPTYKYSFGIEVISDKTL